MTIRSMATNQLNVFRFNGMQFPGMNTPGIGNNQNTNTNNNAAQTTANIRNQGRNILEAVNGFTQEGGNRSVFNAIIGASSAQDVATVAVDGNRTISSMRPQDTRIDVSQIAQAQANHGYVLDAEDSALNSGGFVFAVESGGRSHTFTVNVLDSDDNESIQRRMAQAINNSGLGVRATVETVTNEDTGETTSALNLNAAQTGTNSAFSVTDVTGNLAGTMGITTANQEARNAVFSLNNGANRTSQTNQISLAAGVTATLGGVGRTEMTFRQDTAQTTSAITELVNSINSALNNTRSADGRGSERFISDIQGMNRTFANQLGRVGVTVGNDGRLSINQDRLNTAAQNGSLERVLGDNSAFMNRVQRIGQNASRENFYVNAPAPVNFNFGGSNNGFDFGNMFDSWGSMNFFG